MNAKERKRYRRRNKRAKWFAKQRAYERGEREDDFDWKETALIALMVTVAGFLTGAFILIIYVAGRTIVNHYYK